MIARRQMSTLRRKLAAFPVVALLGPRQVGKTTLALELARQTNKPCQYLDLERDSDLAKLAEAELYLGGMKGRLVIIDEIQRRRELFPLLRSLVDERRREGERAGHFLVLGSASRDLLQQSSETLAGRIAYLELDPLDVSEVAATEDDLERLWVRGGMPPSWLAADADTSLEWRREFVRTYLERDIPQLGLRLPAERLRRFLAMLAHGQGEQLNAARLASSLGVSGNTVRHYVDVLSDLSLVRQLHPWSGNSRKRLVKSPKIYLRDSGLLHMLAGIKDRETLWGHPLCGPSWEGLIIETLLRHAPAGHAASYYRSSGQAEIDLVLEAGSAVVAIEIKRTLSPRASRGFRSACEDIGATRRLHVIPRGDSFPIGAESTAVGILELLAGAVALVP